MLINQGATFPFVFFTSDATSPGGVSGVTVWNVTFFINGVIAPSSGLHVLSNPASGWYLLPLAPPLTSTIGQLAIEAAGADPVTSAPLVVTFTDIQIVPAASPAGQTIAIQRNAPVSAFPFPMYSPASPPVLLTGLAVSGQRSLDGGALVALAGPVTEIGAGLYSTPLTAAETNGAMIALRFSAAGAQDTVVVVATQP